MAEGDPLFVYGHFAACDRQMDEIITEMERILSANGGDMTLVDTVVETYASEKSLKKAWYMAELEKRGWI